MGGHLLSPNYKPEVATLDDVKIASVVWGATLSLCILTAWKAVEQTQSILQRGKAAQSHYIWMVWIHLIDNFAMSIVCWLFMDGAIAPGFESFFILLTMWMIQVQLLLQIIINRIALIMVNRRKVWRLKWGMALVITIVNISVYSIWLPARLQISPRFVAINAVWDRVEKIIFLLLDGGLNAYFLYLVKTQLLQGGLYKYQRLFNFNAGIIVLSLAMDILLICTMNLPNSFSYIQFHSLAYIVKLYIELTMAELITKVVQANHIPSYSNPTKTQSNSDHSKPCQNDSFSNTKKSNYIAHISALDTRCPDDSCDEILREGTMVPDFGIQKTISTVVRSNVEVNGIISPIREFESKDSTPIR